MPGFVYDQKKAAQLAQEAGVNGLDTQIAYDTTNPEHTAIATIVQAALAPIGINATPTPLPPATFQTQFFQHKLPMAVYAGLGYVDDPNYNPEAFWDSKSFADFSGYKNPKVDATLKALHQEASQPKRLALASKLQSLVQADVPVVPLAQPNVVYAVRADIRRFVPTPLGLIFYEYEQPA